MDVLNNLKNMGQIDLCFRIEFLKNELIFFKMFPTLLPELESTIVSFLTPYDVFVIRHVCKDALKFEMKYSMTHITDWSSSNGYLSLLKWSRINGFPWDEQTCIHAAKNGHL